MNYTYFSDQETPAIQLDWTDGDGATIDFSSGYTFAAKLVDRTNALAYSTTSVIGAATLPNIVVNWVDGAFTGLDGVYELRVYATPASGKADVYSPGEPPIVVIKPAAGTTPLDPDDGALTIAAALELVVLGFNEAAPGPGVWIRLPE